MSAKIFSCLVILVNISLTTAAVADTSFDKIYPSDRPASPASPFAECQKALRENSQSQAEKILSGLTLDTKLRLLDLLSADPEVTKAQSRQSEGASLR